MDKVMSGLIGEICFVYLDDIIIFSQDEDSLLELRLKEFRLQFKLKKCEFMVKELHFLGHYVSFGEIRQVN